MVNNFFFANTTYICYCKKAFDRQAQIFISDNNLTIEFTIKRKKNLYKEALYFYKEAL